LRKRKKLHHATIGGQADLDFAKEIIEPLLGKYQVAEMKLVQLDRDWLQEVLETLVKRGSRSKEREGEDEIDLEGQFGVIAEDLVGGGGGIQGVIAVEIKVSHSCIVYRMRSVLIYKRFTAEMGFPSFFNSLFFLSSLNQDDLLSILYASILSHKLDQRSRGRLLPSRPLQW